MHMRGQSFQSSKGVTLVMIGRTVVGTVSSGFRQYGDLKLSSKSEIHLCFVLESNLPHQCSPEPRPWQPVHNLAEVLL